MIPKQWRSATEVINTIEQAGFEAFIVGGAVRDYYLEKQNNDVDIATSALPEEIQSIFKQTIDVGIEHGTVLVLDMGEPIEVTTYRTETTYSDHRRPDAVQFVRNLAEDLKRRDFTMNAMALSKSGEFIDLYNGRADIDKKVIRAVGEPDKRFEEDALRMLRAVRFAAQLAFSIDPTTFEAMKQQAASISYIAMERIQVELSKIFTSKNAGIGMEYLQNSGLAQHLPGDFQAQHWQNFNTTNNQVGWAYFYFINEQDISIFSQYRCSNKDKQFAKQVLEAYECMQKGWERIDYLRFELDILQTAYQFAVWQHSIPSFSMDDIAERKKALPIKHASELAISGTDLMNWSTKKGGPWIKTVLDAALLAVINNQVANEQQQLKEWFHAFDDER